MSERMLRSERLQATHETRQGRAERSVKVRNEEARAAVGQPLIFSLPVRQPQCWELLGHRMTCSVIALTSLGVNGNFSGQRMTRMTCACHSLDSERLLPDPSRSLARPSLPVNNLHVKICFDHCTRVY